MKAVIFGSTLRQDPKNQQRFYCTVSGVRYVPQTDGTVRTQGFTDDCVQAVLDKCGDPMTVANLEFDTQQFGKMSRRTVVAAEFLGVIGKDYSFTAAGDVIPRPSSVPK